jgi:acyl carrier protein
MSVEVATVQLLAYVNEELLAGTSFRADAETPLFEDGWIDSLKILKIIAYVETITGREIPDELIVMKNFRSVSTIAKTFAGGEA